MLLTSPKGRILVRLAGGLGLLLGVSLAGLALYGFVTFPDVATLVTANPRSTAFIEARRAEAKGQGHPFNLRWSWAPLTRISPHLQRAVIVAEDASFYQHEGFDWAGVQEAMSRNWERGELHRGGSTITQQLAKNLYLSPDKNLVRKAQEALITRALERRLRKKRILEVYLNVVEWGDGVFGAEAAARRHFGKSAADLTPEEAALLAAMLPDPQRYDPLRVTPYLAKRQQQILRWMHRNNH